MSINHSGLHYKDSEAPYGRRVIDILANTAEAIYILNLQWPTSSTIPADLPPTRHRMDGSNPTSYTIYSIPSIPTHRHILQFKELRLRALETDPEHFGSTYDQALSLSYEQWKSRIQSRDKVTIIAAIPSSSGEEWVGMITLAGRKTLHKFDFAPPRAARVQVGEEYFAVFSVWVDPEHRRKGLGRKLMESGINWIKSDDGPADLGVEKRTILLQVTESNQAAIGLYSAMGFKIIESDEGVEDKKPWMCFKLGD
ncbi:hypothetical protein NP233_g8697 [Leucocoprinus birnbaumii]|uniref:N-acetyltransferase domain-containing protein n=1 Tax=Leucocoprinus birnbaumii TaxID=56174 RepID=A0AAD5YRL6_9AGAR|nr:hypothetical protein NP233_g8697 [Leucocoprinus birnbaumii]